MFNLNEIDRHFPLSEYREGQREAIEFALDAFNSGKNFVIIEAPTGSGKTVIGMTIADMVERAYYLTVTKQLQDQLVGDFGNRIVELKGRNAYPCTFWERQGARLVALKALRQDKLEELLQDPPGCELGFCRRSGGATTHRCVSCFKAGHPTDKVIGDLQVLPPGMNYSACPYYEQVYRAMNGRKVVMNFSSFLNQTAHSERFQPRDLMVIDESHATESHLLDFVSFTLSDLQLQQSGIYVPDFEVAGDYAIWIHEAQVLRALGQLLQQARAAGDFKTEDEYARLLKKTHRFMQLISDDPNNWICEHQESDSHRSVIIKPIFVNHFAGPLLFSYGRKVLMLSATILDPTIMCNSLGIEQSQVASYRMGNRFPLKNRPIYIRPVAKMTGGPDKMRSDWGPKLVKGVEDIVKQYPDQRGIIHTHNFAIAQLLMDTATASVNRRFLFQKDFRDKRELLEAHKSWPNGIIVAPAMHEGLDLVGDLSRFQIICKVPYPNFYDDKQLAKRMEVDPNYYDWLVSLKLVQSVGRSVRSKEDWADTYIIDAAITQFVKKARRLLPRWFLEALQ